MAQNLPQYAMPIIGREREIAAVSAALQRTRVVSIVGPGGIGKTRLAVEVAIALGPEQRDGAVRSAMKDEAALELALEEEEEQIAQGS